MFYRKQSLAAPAETHSENNINVALVVEGTEIIQKFEMW